MTWNYRVIEFVDPYSMEPWRAIHEVYYDEGGKPTSYSEHPAGVVWDTEIGDGEPSRVLEKLAMALRHPVLVERDFLPPNTELSRTAKRCRP